MSLKHRIFIQIQTIENQIEILEHSRRVPSEDSWFREQIANGNGKIEAYKLVLSWIENDSL